MWLEKKYIEGFSQLKMCFSDVQDRLILESLASVHNCVQKDFQCRRVSVSEISAVNLNLG